MSEINAKNENPKKSCLQSCRSAALERVKDFIFDRFRDFLFKASFMKLII